MLRQSDRAESLKRRISGPRGHLSNDEAAALVAKFASGRLKKIFLAHLSEECNAPRIAQETMRAELVRIGRGDIELEVL
jgi:phosphoribosyl 1,2-cyclic phosphodiesterase